MKQILPGNISKGIPKLNIIRAQFEVMHKGERRHPFCAMAENTAEGGEGKLPQTPEKKYWEYSIDHRSYKHEHTLIGVHIGVA